MTITTMSGRAFNLDVAGAMRAAEKGPVVITDRGQPAFVLQRYEEWRRQTGTKPDISLLEALADPDAAAAFDFAPPKARLRILPADLS